jgi:hypothetical protein
VNSLVSKTGDVIGDGMLVEPLGILDLAKRSGDDGPGGTPPGDWWRLEPIRLGSTRLFRLRSRDLVLTILLRLKSAVGELERR